MGFENLAWNDAVLFPSPASNHSWTVASSGDVRDVLRVGWDGTAHTWASEPAAASPSAIVIGTRRASEYSLSLAQETGAALAEAGRTLVTTAAAGCSLAAARAAIAAGGDVVIVTPAGLDAGPWPRVGEDVWDSAVGLVSVTDRDHVSRYDFLRRNRFLNDLGLPLVVCDVGPSGPGRPSGIWTLAAEHAAQGGTVLAYPHPTTGEGAPTNGLFQQGIATMLNGIDDLSRELDLNLRQPTRERE